jgi:hypothetical protein
VASKETLVDRRHLSKSLVSFSTLGAFLDFRTVVRIKYYQDSHIRATGWRLTIPQFSNSDAPL